MLGKRTDHDRHNMYYSPFRDERTPSFHINLEENTWYDFGTNEGGGVLSFVCKLRGCGKDEAYDFLASISGTVIQDEGHLVRPERKERSAAVTVLKAGKEFHAALLQYAGSRGIPEDVLVRYCDDVTYSVEGCPGKRFFAIGFRNSAGGYVLRNRNYKMCSSSAATFLGPDGKETASPSSDKVLVFEGFMDFLSYVVIHGGGEPGYDICVLNSVANLEKCLDWLYAHQTVGAYLDNDAAGKRALALISEGLPEGKEGDVVCDLSGLYPDHKDLNEMLCASLEGQQPPNFKYQAPWNNQFHRKFRKD